MLLENDGDIGLMALVLAAKEEGHVTREGMAALIEAFSGDNPSMEQLSTKADELGIKPADSGDLLTMFLETCDIRLVRIPVCLSVSLCLYCNCDGYYT